MIEVDHCANLPYGDSFFPGTLNENDGQGNKYSLAANLL